MPDPNYARLFARDVAVDPPVGGQTNVQAALSAGGGGGLTVVKFAFDHTMLPGLAAGVKVATLPAGAVLLEVTPSISLTVGFDGTTPHVHVGTTQSDAVNNNNTFVSGTVTGTDSADPVAPSFQLPFTSPPQLLIEGAPCDIWVALTDGAGGNPGSAVGAGRIILMYA